MFVHPPSVFRHFSATTVPSAKRSSKNVEVLVRLMPLSNHTTHRVSSRTTKQTNGARLDTTPEPVLDPNQRQANRYNT